MPRNQYINEPPDPNFDPKGAPVKEVKKEFARRLSLAMAEKGWNQSETARRAGLRRDNLSGYVTGKNMPGDRNLHELARALGVEKHDLLPTYGVPSVGRDFPSFEAKDAGEGMVWFVCNRKITWQQFMKIGEILNEPSESH